jgi:hypothetical protein
MMKFLATAFLMVMTPCLMAADAPPNSWPRWRGPDDFGSTAQGEYLAEFGPDTNLAWKVELPGRGCSTPAVLGDQILLTCPIDGTDAVLSYDWNGQLQWQTKVGPEKPGKHRNGSAANSSPVTDGKFLFAYFRSGNLAGLDLS